MPALVAGGVYDLYRMQVLANPTVYAPDDASEQGTDDFLTNAVHPQSPSQPSRTLNEAYTSQQTVDSWNTQLRQLHKQI